MYEEYYYREEIQEISNRIEDRARSLSRTRSRDIMTPFSSRRFVIFGENFLISLSIKIINQT
jgi:hypothetical protein